MWRKMRPGLGDEFEAGSVLGVTRVALIVNLCHLVALWKGCPRMTQPLLMAGVVIGFQRLTIVVKSGGGGPALFGRFPEVNGTCRIKAMQFRCSIVTHRAASLCSCPGDHVRVESSCLQNMVASDLGVVPK